jgi:hypothetical protein
MQPTMKCLSVSLSSYEQIGIVHVIYNLGDHKLAVRSITYLLKTEMLRNIGALR